LELIYDSY
jgi:histidyl-tRNA synthetase